MGALVDQTADLEVVGLSVPVDDHAAAVGACLEDRYRLDGLVGTGGMAQVYRALDLRDGSWVAIKVFSGHPDNPVAAERFLREIETASGLDHPHILPVYESGVACDVPYYVMPLMADGSLRQRLAQEGPVPGPEALGIVRQVVEALLYAHGRGIVHRDIKPDNIMCAGDHVFVADFGIAKPVAPVRRPRLTIVGFPLGTPAYMAPEQVLGEDTTDHRADIYAVGVLLFELLTGVPPFQRATADQLMAAHLNDSPPNITSHQPGICRPVANLIAKCLHKHPARRWRSSERLLRQLDAVLANSRCATAERTASAVSAMAALITMLLALVAGSALG
jgi:serine/threonine protein kinase